MLQKTLKTALLVSLFAFSAPAATIMEMDSASIGDIGDGLDFTIPSFVGPGTLTKVTVELIAPDPDLLATPVEGDFTATNGSTTASSFSGTFTLGIQLNTAFGLGDDILTITPSTAFGPTPIAAGETISFTESISDSGMMMYNDAGSLALFGGGGPLLFSADLDLDVDFNTNVKPFLTSTNDVRGDIKLLVTYETDEDPDPNPVVPEPMSLYLMSGGLLGLGLLRLRRKKN